MARSMDSGYIIGKMAPLMRVGMSMTKNMGMENSSQRMIRGSKESGSMEEERAGEC